jgi:hypothetical protein
MTRKSMATAGGAAVPDEPSDAPMSPRTQRALGMEPSTPPMAACDGQGDTTARTSPRCKRMSAGVHDGTTPLPHDPLASATDHLASATDPLASATDHLADTSDLLAHATDHLAKATNDLATRQADIDVTYVEAAKERIRPRMATSLEPVAESLSRSSVLQEFFEADHDFTDADQLLTADESAADYSSPQQVQIQIDTSSALDYNTTVQTL